jgi:triphosphatase
METELKLLIDNEHIAALRQHPLLAQYAVEKPHEQTLVSTYFDTPDLHVRRRGAALRVRQSGNDWLQALKTGGSVSGGLHRREEWEGKTGGPSLDLAALRSMVGPRHEWSKLLLDPAFTDALAPRFTTRITRTVWELRLPHGAEVEFALDLGTIEHEYPRERGDDKVKDSSAISEVEIELKSGDTAELFAFALQLLETIPLQIGSQSKAERGYAIVNPPRSTVHKAERLDLARDMTVEQGFEAIIANCLAQIHGNETGVMQGSDPESVHQMRVGLRRLRSALRLFKNVIAVPAALQEELQWLTGELGAARDWEVLSISTLPRISTAAMNGEAAPLQGVAAEVARAKREQAAVAMKSTRYTKLMLSFAAWMAAREWRAHDGKANRKLDAPLRKFADEELVHDQHRMIKHGKHLQDADPQTRHKLRIAAKKTRYATEFFQSLYSSKRVGPYVKTLTSLQDELGWLNDAAVAERLLHELQETHPDVGPDAGFARGYLHAQVHGEDHNLQRLWKRFKPLPPPCGK